MANANKRRGDKAELEVQAILRECKRCGSTFTRTPAQRRFYCPACERLVKAEKTRHRRDKARLVSLTGDESWHGTAHGYTNHCCRCDGCRAAYRAYHDEWRKRPEIAERIRARARVLAKRPDQVLKKKATQYGVDAETLGEYLADGICFACGKHASPLYVDHDHDCCPSFRKVCGECVRGLLCRECNQALGLVRDRREQLQGLIDYLDRWEARRASQ